MIRLAPFKQPDFQKLISWIGNEELLVQVAGTIFTYPLTEEQLTTYLEDSNRHAFKVIDSQSKESIGHAELYNHEDNA